MIVDRKKGVNLFFRTVTNSLDVETTYNLDVVSGIVQVGSFIGPACTSCGDTSDTSYTYDDSFRVLQKTDALGVITAYTYDDDGNRLTKTEAQGTTEERTTTYTYTDSNDLETVSVTSVADTDKQHVITMTYDDNGNMLTRTESGYNADGAISKTSTYTYNSTGQITSIDGPRTDVDDITTMTYYDNDSSAGDDRGQLHTVTNAMGRVTTFSDYNAFGQAETVTDANGLVTTRTYTTAGLLSTSTTGDLTTSYSYDAAGVLQSITRPGDRVITYGYDDGGRLTTVTDTAGNSINYTYDSEGQKIGEKVKDSSDTLTYFANYAYTDAGQLATEELLDSAQRSYTYDERKNLIGYDDATNLSTTMSYDSLGRQEATWEGSTETAAYDYDTDDNLTSVTDALDHATEFVYDDFGRRTYRAAPDTSTTSYTYDTAGNLKSETDALSQTVSYTYDALNRPLTETFGSATISFAYDGDDTSKGKLSSVTDAYGEETFTYDSQGRLLTDSRAINSASTSTSYSYDATTGDLSTMTYPSGMVVASTYDVDGNITALTIDGTTAISAITHLPFGPLATATLGDTALTRTYDQRYNLTALAAGTWSTTYGHDAEGNVTSITDQPAPSTTETYSYDSSNNQLTQRASSSAPKNYAYNAAGNITTDGTLTLTYDALHRISQVSDSDGVVATYGYDASNRRIIKTVGSTVTHYIYDASSNLIAETDADGAVSKEYIYLDGTLIAIKDYGTNAGLYYAITDNIGTPQQLITASGTVVWQASYLPFGEAQVTTSTVTNNIRFPGQYFDEETGLHYNWHRFYDPETGRYVSADPIGLAGGINLYGYVEGDPVNWIDPWGLAIGDYPPPPPGYNPGTWGHGTWPNDKPYVTDPEGNNWTVHPEDKGHWPHWDKENPGEKQKPVPPNSKKPLPGQKKLKKGRSFDDPNGSDYVPWAPPQEDEDEEMCGENCQKIVAGVGKAGLIIILICTSPFNPAMN